MNGDKLMSIKGS